MGEHGSKRKIFVITQNYPYEQGEESFIEPELKVMVQSNKFDITIISNTCGGNKISFSLAQDLKCEKISNVSLAKRPVLTVRSCLVYFFSKQIKKERREIMKERQWFGKLWDSLLFFIRSEFFYNELQKRKIDLGQAIVYTYWCNVETLAIALHKKQYENMKLISRIHGFDLYDERTIYGRQPFRNIIDGKLNELFFIAQTGMDYYTAKMGNSSRYVLSRLGIRNNYPLDKIVDKQKYQDAFWLVSCSNIIPLKRIELIIDALSKINELKIKWIHFGDGVLRKTLKERASRCLGDKANISFVFEGQVDNQKIYEFYMENYVDCFITTSQTEGCPVTIQEAMSFGIPIIGTAVGEIPLMIRGNGILLNENPTTEQIAKAIDKVYRWSADKKKEARRQSRELWERYFNGEKNHKVFLENLLRL